MDESKCVNDIVSVIMSAAQRYNYDDSNDITSVVTYLIKKCTQTVSDLEACLL